MSDHWDTINARAEDAATFRLLKAYAVCADGSRQPLDCAAIYIELDDQRGLVVSLAERQAGEGVAICSLPQGALPVSASPSDGSASTASPSAGFSTLVLRSGGANLVYLSPELHPRAGEDRC
ncbi:MAG: hypothetical protein VKO39_02705 [Cyanobacteriota bacterium]|nr:hypothetical protein [Cyanobacteriota bacterium]